MCLEYHMINEGILQLQMAKRPAGSPPKRASRMRPKIAPEQLLACRAQKALHKNYSIEARDWSCRLVWRVPEVAWVKDVLQQ